ncbi:hypothetical protein NDU88_005548 [Pleurodeles waltl]|uniref:Uncharacterized protein n=1 Tax=Pleurodeles waltl TaxID=8319 RepID=A0AAV7QF69_PLEWA|nr:hypothetical protein NDU88_005548 [Pleurodeles waltl]
MVSLTTYLFRCPLHVGRLRGGGSNLPLHCDLVRVAEGCAAPCSPHLTWAPRPDQGGPKKKIYMSAQVDVGAVAAVYRRPLVDSWGLSAIGPRRVQVWCSSAMGASMLIVGAVRSEEGEPAPSRQRSATGQRGRAWLQFTIARGAEHHVGSSTVAITPSGGGSHSSAQLARPGPLWAPPLQLGVESGPGPRQHTHRLWTWAPSEQASDFSPVEEATPESRRGSLFQIVVLGSWAKGAFRKDAMLKVIYKDKIHFFSTPEEAWK